MAVNLTDFSKNFIKIIDNGDWKIVYYSENIVNNLIKQSDESDANYLILSGDLTFNGEKESHIDLSKKLN